MLQTISVSELNTGMIIRIPDECYIKITSIITPKGASNMRIITGKYSNKGVIFSEMFTSTIYRNINDQVYIVIDE